MDMVSILSRVASGLAVRAIAAGLAVRAIAAGLAIYAVCEAYSYVRHVFTAANAAMGVC